ncbi:DUF7146 domain-containing protein [Croceicoccus marinus]|uniref:Toprim domain-containing protein n=1 Tax=Croceicoccus marinus TaxID=450378 RepID=A0A7G6W1C4_9SPHN|nr:toprim domain-containing protein [Croceicoccus marinus]QNE07789.1 toprim domain-containing protein [Croceicoccus marinus]
MAITARQPTQELVDLVGALGGRWHGPSAMCRCPAHADQTASLSLRQGDKGILVHCFAGCHPDDVLRELGRIKPGRAFPRPETTTPRDPSELVARMWSEGRAVAATPAEAYLRRRFLTPHFSDLRYHPRCPKGRKPLTVFLPALLVGVRNEVGICAIQRIFLDVEHGGYTEKMLLGETGTGSWRGTPTEETVAIAEGFETAAAFTQLHGIPCWASMGAKRLGALTLPSGVTSVILAEDNGTEGRRAGSKAFRAYRAQGRGVRRMPPPRRFGDWADVMEAQQRGEGVGR